MNRRLVHSGLIIIATLFLFCQELMSQCPQFLPGSQLGIVQAPSLDEISGIAASRKNTEVLWAHNDSGSDAQLWALNTKGTHLGRYTLTSAGCSDWEDMAIGPGPDPNTDYLYVSDAGNNEGLTNSVCSIYRVAEPVVSAAQQPVSVHLDDIETFPVKYPDNLRHDCETLLVDPLNGDIYLCTRDRWNDDHGITKVYRYPAPQTPDVVFTLQHVADVPLAMQSGDKKPNLEMATGGDVSPDGAWVVVRTKSKRKSGLQRILLWQRRTGATLWQAFDNPPCVVASLPEPQGEAICFDADSSGYYTVSEGLAQPIYYFAHGKAQ